MRKEEMESALLAANGSRPGARVPGCTRELIEAGYASKSGNLTERGAQERDKIMTRRLDEAFG